MRFAIEKLSKELGTSARILKTVRYFEGKSHVCNRLIEVMNLEALQNKLLYFGY